VGARARLLGQHVVVVQAHAAALHQCCCHLGQRGVERRGPVVGVVLPVAEVLDEEARVVRLAGDDGARAGSDEVGVDAAAQALELGGVQQAAQADRTVALVRRHGGWRGQHGGSFGPFRRTAWVIAHGWNSPCSR
jgi:hypothetical protein